jgi:hypothetical protein
MQSVARRETNATELPHFALRVAAVCLEKRDNSGFSGGQRGASMLKVTSLILGLLVGLCGPVFSATYFVAPLGAAVSGTPDGTEKSPFPSLIVALKSGVITGGDTLLLLDGVYGDVKIEANAAFDDPVTIMPKNGKAAHFDSIELGKNTRNLILRNLSVWPRDPATAKGKLVFASRSTSYITIDGFDIRSERDAGNYMQWDAARWEARKYMGVHLQGPHSLVIRTKATGVYHGIVVGEDSQIIDSIVDGFNGDGMRAFSRSVVRGNRISNSVDTDDNHDDGFQSFPTRGTTVVTGLVLDSNTIIEWTGRPDHPLRDNLQGIGLFDGFYDNLTIVNNVVAVSHTHGISVYGTRGARIINNTVVNIRDLTLGTPRINIKNHKNGSPSQDVLVANNLAMSVGGTASELNRIVFRSNSAIGKPSMVFENPTGFNFLPKVSSGFIDTADPAVAPGTDIIGTKRPSGAGPDRGAYEVRAKAAAVPPAQVKPSPIPSPVAPAPTPVGPSVVPSLPKSTLPQPIWSFFRALFGF